MRRFLAKHELNARALQAEWERGAVSAAQLEPVAYAMQSFRGPRLRCGARQGFFLGDGAGVGKGRTISATISEAWRHGTRRILWLSVSSDLREDARRDMTDVGIRVPSAMTAQRVGGAGALTIDVQPRGNATPPAGVDIAEMLPKGGVFFATYSLLIHTKDGVVRAAVRNAKRCAAARASLRPSLGWPSASEYNLILSQCAHWTDPQALANVSVLSLPSCAPLREGDCKQARRGGG